MSQQADTTNDIREALYNDWAIGQANQIQLPCDAAVALPIAADRGRRASHHACGGGETSRDRP
jgi:hypothetical protein